MKHIKFWSRIRRVDVQVSILLILTAIFSSFLVFVISYNMAYRDMILDLEERVYSIYHYLEDELDKDSFSKINVREDQNQAVYHDMKKMLEDVKRSTGVRYLYTAKKNDNGDFIYVVDGLDTDASDFRYPGDPIEQEIHMDMWRALLGETVLPSGIKDTEWGKIFITYLPIHDGEQIIGVLGIEFEAERQYNTYGFLRVVIPIIALLICLICTWTAIVIFKRISNPIYQDMFNTDQLTQLKNRNAYEIDVTNLEAQHDKRGLGVIAMDLNNLKTVNDVMGHGKGDLYIQGAAQAIREAVWKKEAPYRVGGDEYMVLMKDVTEKEVKTYIQQVEQNFESFHLDGEIQLSLAIGYALYDPEQDANFASICRRADANMYENKKEYHQACILA